MSEGLQKVAGSRLKKWVRAITSNRFSGVLTGFGVTAIVQSSSATTVMVVGFVTAGLLTLSQAIGVIMGANIGTTVTGWLVALLGFKVKITTFALPAVGLGFALSFTKKNKLKEIGEVFIGFGVLFLGLGLIKDSVPALSGPETLAWMQQFTNYGYLSFFLFVLIGTALTIVLQSSSATMTLTLSLAALGWLPYEMAAAMVLGENVGTTATANLAAIGTSVDARRAARAHLVFNIVGVIWALLCLKWFLLPLVDVMVPGDPSVDFASLQGDEAAIAVASAVVTTHLAAFHTTFNIINTSIMLFFIKKLESLVVKWVPESEAANEVRAKFITPGIIDTPDLALVQARKEMAHMAGEVRKMFEQALYILSHPKNELGKLVEDTMAREAYINGLEKELTHYLAEVARASTSSESSDTLAEMLLNTHRLERVGDHCAVLVRIAQRLHSQESGLREQDAERFLALGQRVDEALDVLVLYLQGERDPLSAEAIEDAIDALRRSLREEEIRRLEAKESELIPGLAVLDVLTHLEEIGDRAVGIVRLAEARRARTGGSIVS